MEADHPLNQPFQNYVRIGARRLEAQDKSNQASREAESAESNFLHRYEEMVAAVNESTDLTDIQKAAWLTALKWSLRNPRDAEEIADENESMLTKLDQALSQQNLPLLEIKKEEGSSTVTIRSYESTGKGLELSLTGNTVKAVAELQHFPRPASPYILSINLFNLENVVVWPKDVDAVDLVDTFGFDDRAATTYVFGEEAIIGFTEKLISAGYQEVDFAIEDILLDSRFKGIDFSERSEVIKQYLEHKKQLASQRAAEMIFEQIIRSTPLLERNNGSYFIEDSIGNGQADRQAVIDHLQLLCREHQEKVQVGIAQAEVKINAMFDQAKDPVDSTQLL